MPCLTCRDKGTFTGCTVCGKVRAHSGNEFVELTVATKDSIKIPTYYHNTVWSADTLRSSNPDLAMQAMFKRYVLSLDALYKRFEKGILPTQTLFIQAPRRRSKRIWAYSCMMSALHHGYTVAPMIDTSEWRRANVMSSERSTSKYSTVCDMTVEEFLTRDVMFITVDLDNYQTSYRAIESLIDKRSRRDLNTIILSRYSIQDISMTDYTQSFEGIEDNSRMLDLKKYIEVVRSN